MKKNYDITVVGNGLTGLTASLALSSLGYKIALIDPRPLLFNKNYFQIIELLLYLVVQLSFIKK